MLLQNSDSNYEAGSGRLMKLLCNLDEMEEEDIVQEVGEIDIGKDKGMVIGATLWISEANSTSS